MFSTNKSSLHSVFIVNEFVVQVSGKIKQLDSIQIFQSILRSRLLSDLIACFQAKINSVSKKTLKEIYCVSGSVYVYVCIPLPSQ